MKVKWHFRLSVFLLIAFSVLFWLWPQIDIEASAYFYQNQKFLLQHSLWSHVEKFLLKYLMVTFIFLLIVAWLAHLFRVVQKNIQKKVLLFWTLSTILAPGLIVNSLLKMHWGRSRPEHVQHFGGEAAYSKVWMITHQSYGNYSFTCGDAAAAFIFICLIPSVPQRHRIWVASLVLSFALLVGFMRLATGAHFLSDILLSYCIDYIVVVALFWYLFCKKHTSCSQVAGGV